MSKVMPFPLFYFISGFRETIHSQAYDNLFYSKTLPKYQNCTFHLNKKLEMFFQNMLKDQNSMRGSFKPSETPS